MKIEQSQIEQIKAFFEKMQSREDLLHLLNVVKPMIYGEKCIPFKLKQLTWHANPQLNKNRYKEFKITKKSGNLRTIHAPVKGLKALQKSLAFILQCVYEPHKAAMGFVRGRSIVDNARLHTGSNYVYNIDLKDFFPSIDQARVWKTLQLKPFNLNKEYSQKPKFIKWEDFSKRYHITEASLKFEKEKGRVFASSTYGNIYVAKGFDIGKEKYLLINDHNIEIGENNYPNPNLLLVNNVPDSGRLQIANIIASLCCTEIEVERKNESGEWEKVKRNVLPQGAPTSPVITNIVCQKLDYLLTGVANRFGLKYSRYADDITFSSMHNVYQKEGEFLKELHRIIAEQHFHIKESKTRLQKEGYRKEVTGLLVNSKPNVQRRYVKQLRMWLHYWNRYGYERASEFFLQQYLKDKGHIIKGKPNMENVIAGKLDYLRMVIGTDNGLYRKLHERFEFLAKEDINLNKDKMYADKDQQDKKTTAHLYPNTLQIPTEKVCDSIEKIKVIISSLHSISSTGKLKKDITISKGEKLPFEKNFENVAESIKNVRDAVTNKLIIHDPLTTVDLLNKFTEDTKLKYTTHLWDYNTETGEEVVNRNTFQRDIENEFRRKFKFKKLEDNGLKNLYNVIWNFLIGPNKFGWGRHKLNFGWYNSELIDFYKNDYNKKPGSFLVPEMYLPKGKVDGKYLTYFEDFINIFKSEIEFRGNALYYLFKNHFDFRFEYKIEIDEALKGISIYTDTKLVSEAIELIASNIKQRNEKNKHIRISYKYKNEDKCNEITILDLGSFSLSPLTNEKIALRNNKGQIKSIREKLCGLCDFSIESIFKKDGKELPLELVYLSKDRKVIPEDEPQFIMKEINHAEGFAYKLKFYE